MSIKHHFRPALSDWPRAHLPTPPLTPGDDLDDAVCLPDLPTSSTLVLSSSPLGISSSRKRKWSESANVTMLQLAMLRQLAPEKNTINWQLIADEVVNQGHIQPTVTAGRVRSHFFSLMHNTARSYSVPYRQMSGQLALNNDSLPRLIPRHTLSSILSDCTDVSTSDKGHATKALNDAAFSAKLREAADARKADRPDVMAQHRASQAHQSSQRIKRETVAVAALTIDQRLAQLPILNDSIPVQPASKSTHRIFEPYRSAQPPILSSQPASSQSLRSSQPQSHQLSSQSSAAAQLASELKSQLRREVLDNDERRRQHCEQKLAQQTSKRIYLSAIDYSAKQHKQRQKCYVFERMGGRTDENLKGKSKKQKLQNNVKEKHKHKTKIVSATHEKKRRRKQKTSTRGSESSELVFANGSAASTRFAELKERLAAKQKAAAERASVLV
ncbi:hypothetical protein LTS08_000482 [Lithohypha guttulata]|nr:hypothetical protein LTS08_000482 [Lithohypha guttulata]